MSKKIGVGIVGCGNISDTYFENLTKKFPWIDVLACSDLLPERAKEKALKYGVKRHLTTEEILADPSIDLVVNLSVPKQHASLNIRALQAGKHVHVEKPFAITREDGIKTLELAKKNGLLISCAPDTFLGTAGQTCRSIIDSGAIGRPTSAMAFMVCRGHESWHPDPEFYYEAGGGPMLDMGPYYLTALVNLLGPMRRVSAITGKAFNERTITSEKKNGKKIPVETPTHQTGAIEFASGAITTVVMSFDVWRSSVPRIEIHGTDGSLSVPDPNGFEGASSLYKPGKDAKWDEIASKPSIYGRGIGAADTALALLNGGEYRCNGEMAFHVLDAMLAFEESSVSGKSIELKSTCKQPAALPADMQAGNKW